MRLPVAPVITVLIALLAACSPPTSSPRTPAAEPVAQLPVAAPPATAVPQSSATPIPFTLLVTNTDGEGVYIRRTMAAADRIRAWPDGTPMRVVGEDTQADGRTWKNVQDPEGNVGWVPAEYLATAGATPAPTP